MSSRPTQREGLQVMMSCCPLIRDGVKMAINSGDGQDGMSRRGRSPRETREKKVWLIGHGNSWMLIARTSGLLSFRDFEAHTELKLTRVVDW